MSRRSRAALATLAALLAAAVLIGGVPARALAADPIIMEARALVAGRFESSGWAAISVRLSNDGEPITGYVVADSQDGTVRRLVELPAGSRKQVMLYVRPANFARTVEVRFETQAGERVAAAEATVRVLERTTANVGIVGDGTGIIRPQIIGDDFTRPEPVPMATADIPERPEPLRGFEALVWAGDSGTLTEAQRRTLERWVAAGGQLIVVGGADWQARAAAFDALLPVEGLRSIDQASLEAVADWVGGQLPEEAPPATVSVGSLRPGAVELLSADDRALLASVTRGAGQVTWVGVDLATNAFRAWTGASALWERLIADDRLAEQFGGLPPIEEDVAATMVQALSNLPALDVPPAELLVGVLAGYILLIGPVSYVVLRRLDRRELAWVTAPLLVLVFSSVSYGIGASMKGSDVILNEVAVVRTTTDGTAASVSTFVGVFSPARRAYDLTVQGDALFSRLVNVFDGTEPTGTLATEQGDPSRLRGLAVSVFGLEGVRADTLVPYSPALSVTWNRTGTEITGRVTNTGEAPLEDVAVITESGGRLIGDLAGGEAREFELSIRAGRRASEEIYGFGGDARSERQREVALRRQVIDTLVGYGDQFGRVGGSGRLDGGPFVIGWQQGASPVAMAVEGEEAQHYIQAVEVVSGRPQLGPGVVSIQPSEIRSTAIDFRGEANEQEPGYVLIGEGEATFSLTLPLEATGLVPSALTLLVANDPSVIVFNQPNFGAVLPQGYRVEVWDADAGAWQPLGDLSQRSRFAIQQPIGLLDDAGRILVKVIGEGVDPSFGPTNVFVGASVEGVI